MAYVKVFYNENEPDGFVLMPMFGDRNKNVEIYRAQVVGLSSDGLRQIMFTKDILSDICHKIGKYYRVCTIVYKDDNGISDITTLSINCNNIISRFDDLTDIRRIEFSNYNDMFHVGVAVFSTGEIDLIGDEIGLCDIEDIVIPILKKWLKDNRI